MSSSIGMSIDASLMRESVRQATARDASMPRYFLVSYLAVLINASGYLRHCEANGFLTTLFIAAVYLSYSFLYLLPVFLPVALLERVLAVRPMNRLAGTRVRTVIVGGMAVLGTSLVHMFIYTDRIVFDLYGFHFNGFVWNLIFTRGGLESMGGGDSTWRTYAFVIATVMGVQTTLLVMVMGIPKVRAVFARGLSNRRMILAVLLIVATGLFERATYGVSHLRGYRPVLAASGAFPFYMPTTLTKIARSFGIDAVRQTSLAFDGKSFRTDYPKHPIERTPVAKPLNIVWLVAESLRGDVVDPEIMPNTWRLAQEAVWCRQHYSGGNGTRMGMFSMFYGLYGCLWFPIFEEQRAPVLMDVIQQAGYQIEMFTSASFTYPEFDRTMFVNLPKSTLHESETPFPWRRDIENVGEILKFIEERDPAKPFMTFMFFETTHAPYHFPKAAVIRPQYLADLNYAKLDLNQDITPIKNRYLNACHHLDSQIARILAYLREHQLMDSTVVMITGDHGEEFMEKGRWGHNSDFTEEQTRPPFVMWVPGAGHRELRRMTSHLDIPATLMPLLGVTNPPRDYSHGYDILGNTVREYTVIADWDRIAYVDQDFKLILPFNVYGFADNKITTRDDGVVKDIATFDVENRQRLTRLMTDMKSFSR